tara:strand:+ start:461 stop:1039 length:579 start_codon:yes stop_codon:yes gene_type:complete
MGALEELKMEFMTCRKCVELNGRTQIVFGSGNLNAKVLFIGEAPGGTEDKQGVPFCGMAGKVLNSLLEEVGLVREDVFITNTLLCRPPLNRNPTSEEMDNCSVRLDRLIGLLDPAVIVTLGNFATKRILGKSGITSLRGKVFSWKGRSVVPVVHPAAYLYSGRSSEVFSKMVADMETVVSEMKKEKKTLLDY